jgi:hypothetical protein
MTVISNAATTTTTTVTTTIAKPVSNFKLKHHKAYHHCSCYRHKKHYKTSYPTESYYYAPGYCVPDACARGGKVCYPAQYYQCRTDYYYHSGRNTARVEVCD